MCKENREIFFLNFDATVLMMVVENITLPLSCLYSEIWSSSLLSVWSKRIHFIDPLGCISTQSIVTKPITYSACGPGNTSSNLSKYKKCVHYEHFNRVSIKINTSNYILYDNVGPAWFGTNNFEKGFWITQLLFI